MAGANYKAHLVGVLGFPVAENPTCLMQEAAFAAAGINWRYLTIEVRPEQLSDALRGLRAMNFRGINLTIPHKVAVLPLLDEIRPDAAMIGAVNTVRIGDDGRLIGENTDGKGFLRGVRQEAGVDVRGTHVAILGAGGAARAIAVELALAGAARLTVVNRDPTRGTRMVGELRGRIRVPMELVPWRDCPGGSGETCGFYRVTPDVDILVNATSVGLYPDIEAMPRVALQDARRDLLVCDAVPNPPRTRLLREAEHHGLRVLNGLAMLVYQGAIGFEMWTGLKPDKGAMKRALENAFAPRPSA